MQTADLCRKHGINPATSYQWKAKFGRLKVSEARRLRTLDHPGSLLRARDAEGAHEYMVSGDSQ